MLHRAFPGRRPSPGSQLLRSALLALAIPLALTPAPAPAQSPAGAAQRDTPSAVSSEPAYSASSANAGREGFPRLEGELEISLQNDATFRSQESGEINSLFAEGEADLRLVLSPIFSVESVIALVAIEDADDGRLEERLRARDESDRNREFDAQALVVEQLLARWRGERFEVHVGKFSPRFGKAFDFEVGPFGDEDDFAEDYALKERIGGGASFEIGTEGPGRHVFSAEAFFLDTSKLSRSALFSRGGLQRSDGGPSNTGSPNSFAFGLEGADWLVPGLEYNLGFVYQHGGRRGPFPRGRGDDLQRDRGSLERDYVAGLGYGFATRGGADVDLLAEYAYLDNADGENGRMREFFTLSGRANWDELRFGLSYTRRAEDVPRGSDERDYLFLTSVGYFRPAGDGEIGFETGYRIASAENQRQNTLALRISYEIDF